MTEQQGSVSTSGKVSGQMFLYKQPELLTPEEHGSLGFTPSQRPYDFVSGERVFPLTITEFSSAQRHYPIIFSNIDNPMPLAVTGLLDERNLFVNDGQWDPMCWVPMYLKCHPFAFAHEGGGRVAVVVDRGADTVTENPTYPFFVGDKVSEQTDSLMRLCAQYDAERRRTVDYANKLKELDLLTTLRAAWTPEGKTEQEPLAEYVGIDTEKFNDLGDEQVLELHTAGFLAATYLQIYSLENWRYLMARREQQSRAA